MPNYAVGKAIGIYNGNVDYFFNAETPAPPQASQAFAPAGRTLDGQHPFSINIYYASAPSAVEVDVQTADIDADANYITVVKNQNTAGGHIDMVNFAGKFVRLRLASQTGGGVITATISRPQ